MHFVRVMVAELQILRKSSDQHSLEVCSSTEFLTSQEVHSNALLHLKAELISRSIYNPSPGNLGSYPIAVTGDSSISKLSQISVLHLTNGFQCHFFPQNLWPKHLHSLINSLHNY